MTALLLHSLRTRSKKSAIINVGSFAGVIPTYFWSVYGGTKAYVNFFSEVLNMEEPNIDVMCLNPNEVQTNMTFQKELDLMTITPYDCVEWALSDLGRDAVTDGHWNHKIQSAIYQWVPRKWYMWGAKHFVIPDMYQKKLVYQQSWEKKQK